MTPANHSTSSLISASSAEDKHLEKKSRFWLFGVTVSAIVLVAAPVGSVVFGSFGMEKSIDSLEGNGATIEELSHQIDRVMLISISGILLTLSALIVLIVSMVRIVHIRSARIRLHELQAAASELGPN